MVVNNEILTTAVLMAAQKYVKANLEISICRFRENEISLAPLSRALTLPYAKLMSPKVLSWFAERVDRIILLFDAHKLDISDEFREAIEALKVSNTLSIQTIALILNSGLGIQW